MPSVALLMVSVPSANFDTCYSETLLREGSFNGVKGHIGISVLAAGQHQHRALQLTYAIHRGGAFGESLDAIELYPQFHVFKRQADFLGHVADRREGGDRADAGIYRGQIQGDRRRSAQPRSIRWNSSTGLRPFSERSHA